MERRRLGVAGPEVGAIGLGCMPMNWAYLGDASEAESISVIHRALDLGVTLFDTADVYGPFTNEDLVGRALDGRHEAVVIATKVGLMVGPNGGYPLQNAGHPDRVRREVEGSLARLRTGTIDLYYLHRIDPSVPLEDTWGAMAELVQAGKVRMLGLSEPSVDEIERASAIHPVTAVQSELSLWTRDASAEVVPWCRAHGVAFVPFSPLGRGFLTGTIAEASFGSADFRAANPRFSDASILENQALIGRVRAIAERHDATPAQVALAWALAQGPHVIPIPGTKRLRWLEENVAATDLRLTAEELADLDALPQPSAPRY